MIQSKTAEPLGTARLYDIRNNSFCWGSWLIKPGSPINVALESALAIYFIGFEILGYNHAHFDVRKGNKSVNRFHRVLGATMTGEDDLNYYYEFTKEAYLKARERYKGFALT